ncbi:MAG: ethylbenzene dehydrogenase-related protein [Candidatus Methanoperedens sp.]|nr:ethylbenzene dehydrogenase-related protein [Candidatus Methanoperedens sp.]MCZ7368989.1 ethylbenzene dehydrogenase-related protein [Candidatus Methanoperedens sp.]
MPPGETSSTITVAFVSGSKALDPVDPAWAVAPEATIDFSRRLNEAGARTTFGPDEIRHAKVKAVHNGTDIFFFYQWNAVTENNSVADYPIFADAFAMEIPLFTEDSPLWMGAMDKPVNIIFWRADLPRPENIVAGGMGTTQISPDEASQNIRHYQKWENETWSLIITRPMAQASENQVSFIRGRSYRIAFANWKGGVYAERGGHKIVSEWQNLSIQ